MQPKDISIGIICPLPIEVAAMIQMLDERYNAQTFPPDPNFYHLGRIGEHSIVIAGLTDGLTGITSAALVAERLWVTFPAVKSLLLVGIGGGAYTVMNDIWLGDIVVSRPDGKYGGAVQYDFGKSLSNGRFERTRVLNSPPQELLLTLAAVRANHIANGTRPPDYLTYLEESQSNPNLKHPGAENDLLFDTNYDHTGGSDCSRCDKAKAIQRKLRRVDGPVVHYGTIASANQLMRDSAKRESYNKEYDNHILCFEMEAAGLLNNTPCLVIRGISDYADSHKREDHVWHGYAAAAAAAFAKEFIKTTPGGSLKCMLTVGEMFASDDTPKALWLVPFQRNTHFIGRESQLNDLTAKLSSETQCQRVAIVGLGGVGKTQIGQLLQIPDIVKENIDVKQLVKEKLSQENAGQWLLIVDNADDTDVLYKRAYGDSGSLALVDYLPSSRRGSVVFTTRTLKAAVKQAGSNVIKLYEMDQVDAKKVLEKSLIHTSILREDDATAKLLDLLSCLPLAIVQPAAFINANYISISSYVALYESGEDEIIELLSEDFEDRGNQEDQLAADYLSFMSCLVPQRIPESLLPPAQSKLKMIAAIGTLIAYSFISRRETEPSFDLHRLVYLATRNWLRKTQSLASWTERTLSWLAEVFPNGREEDRAVWTAYLPHARSILTSKYLLDRNLNTEIELLRKVETCLRRNGQLFEAEQMLRRMLELLNKVSGPEHSDTLTAMHELGFVLCSLGKYFEAEQLSRQVVEFRKTSLGLEHKHRLSSMHALGIVLSTQGKNVEAEQLFRQILEPRNEMVNRKNPNTLSTMHCLGIVLSNQSKFVEAEEIHKQTLELQTELLGPKHPHTLASMHLLSLLLSKQKRFIEAEQIHKQTVELQKGLLGLEHPDTLASMHLLATLLSNQGRNFEAEQIHKQTLQLRKRVLGPEHPKTLASMRDLVMVLRSQDKQIEADEIDQQRLKSKNGYFERST